MRFVYHAKFFEYFEWARTELLRDYGLPYSEIERMGYLSLFLKRLQGLKNQLITMTF
jgi:acyl-CoA thioesterase FadM